MNLFLFILELKGFPIRKAQKELEAFKSLNEKDFSRSVDSLKWGQFNFFKEKNPFYKKIIGDKEITEWKDVPIITKRDLQRPLIEILTEGIKENDVFKNKTSGSSGTPFYFAKDKLAHAKTWALIFDRYSRHDIEYGKSLQARFYGIPLTGINHYKERIKDYLSNRIRFPIFDISDEKLDEFISIFKKNKFEYVNGYTSSLVYFAQYLIKKKIILKEICPSLKICFPTSEMCNILDRSLLEKGFGVKVANEYGCAEMDIIAFEDENFDWIISNENLLLEIVDEFGNAIEPMNSGRVIITSLYNKAIPLIRYELGDIGMLDFKKKGNNSILLELIGRTNDFAILPSGRKVPALTFYYITKELIQQEYGIKEFIIKQISLNLFHFEYVADRDLPIEAILKIRKAASEYLEPNIETTFERTKVISRSKSGKLKQFFKIEE
ncbi:phenylacetate--CoA ligase family protein [Flavobacterium sp.]|jgi:phenylacetate-CoA ligase|uniref:phenylacetate--CoA ligase family protein n=1 Tax=Flavobacterium sp. TaxID=239 RepID=UPI0037C00952